MTAVRKYRIYPTQEQQSAILQTCGCCRVVYNAAMNLRDKFLSEINDFRRDFGVVKRACGENTNTLRETYEQVFSLKQEIQKEASESLVRM